MKARAVREQVVELCADLARRRFLAGTGGNVALRIDAASFAVTPSATDYYTMSAADVSVMRLHDVTQIEGERPPSVESSLHARVLRARADCNCSIHTHQPVASALALLGSSLDVDDPPAQQLLGPRVVLVGYAPSGTGWLAGKLARALHPHVNAYLMRNHGVLCCGPEAQTTTRTVAALESFSAARLRRLIEARAARDPAVRPSLDSILAALGRSP